MTLLYLLLPYVLLLVGFVFLIKGADFFVDGAAGIAKNLKIPSIIIGLTVVAMGTSAPEAAVSVTAALSGQNGMSIGNCLGSNIFNLLVVLGVAVIMRPVPVKAVTVKKDYPYSLLVTLVLLFLMGDVLFGRDGRLSRVDGGILLAFFVFFLFYLIKDALSSKETAKEDSLPAAVSVPKCILFVLLGLAGIVLGGELVVKCASSIASSFGMSDTFIGLTICAIGTSLPELVTSVVAAKKGEIDLAVGNVVGSNIFNLTFVLALSALIHPMRVPSETLMDGTLLILFSMLFFIPILKNKKIGRISGILMVIAYAAYTAYLLLR